MVVLQRDTLALAAFASAAQSEGVPELGEIHPPYRPVLSANQNPAPAAVTPLRRQDPREEPGALAAHAGICAGGEEQSSPLPRQPPEGTTTISGHSGQSLIQSVLPEPGLMHGRAA